jgi:putative ABC transport system permease protein
LNTPAVGKLFTFGVILALMVGAIFVYQMMAADIKKRLPEYATLKAVGYRFGFLFRVVVWQSLFLAAGGFAGGLVASLVLYRVTAAVAQLPVGMTAERLVVVAALTTAMCVGSGLVAVRKVQTADPADLF